LKERSSQIARLEAELGNKELLITQERTVLAASRKRLEDVQNSLDALELSARADALVRRGRYREALRNYEEAAKKLGPDAKELAGVYGGEAVAWRFLGDRERAHALTIRAMSVFKRIQAGEYTETYAVFLDSLGSNALLQGDMPEAAYLFEQSVSIRLRLEKRSGRPNPLMAKIAADAGSAYMYIGDRLKADWYFKLALTRLSTTDDENVRKLKEYLLGQTGERAALQ